MTSKPKRPSATARAPLTLASTRNDHLIKPPRLPVVAARQVLRSLKAGMAEEVPVSAEAADYAWRTCEDGTALMLRATALGLGHSAEEQDGNGAATIAAGTTVETAAEPVTESGPSQHNGWTAAASAQIIRAAPGTPAAGGRGRGQNGLRHAAQALLRAWDNRADNDTDIARTLTEPFDRLRAALALGASPSASSLHQPRDTKHAQVLTMLRRDEGASGPQIAEAMGWAPHTVCASVAKKGIKVHVLERVRQVGPNKTGVKGSYTIYCVAAAPQA